MLGDRGIVNHFFAWTVGNRGNRPLRASSLLGSFLFGVPLPAAGLYIVDTASLTDLRPFITMSLKTITASVAGDEVVKEVAEQLAERLCAALWVKDDKDDRDDKREEERSDERAVTDCGNLGLPLTLVLSRSRAAADDRRAVRGACANRAPELRATPLARSNLAVPWHPSRTRLAACSSAGGSRWRGV
jgi:hypothetical protein